MNGLCRAVPSSSAIRLAGRSFTLTALRLVDMASAETLLVAQRDPIGPATDLVSLVGEALAGGHLLGAQQAVRRERHLREATLAEVLDWFTTPDGLAFALHRVLRTGSVQALASWEEGCVLVAHLDKGDYLLALRWLLAVSGLDYAGNLDWEAPPALRVGREQRSAEPARAIPWKRILRKCALDFGWTPAQVGELTWWQLQVYLAEENQLGGITKMSPAEALAFAAKKRAERAAAGAGRAEAQQPEPDAGPAMHPARREVYAKLARERAEQEASRGRSRQ